MAKKITMKRDVDGLTKEVPVGFSWTTFFFGPFVPLFRGDILTAAVTLALSLVLGPLVQLVMCFMYNNMFYEKQIRNGFKPIENVSQELLEG